MIAYAPVQMSAAKITREYAFASFIHHTMEGKSEPETIVRRRINPHTFRGYRPV